MSYFAMPPASTTTLPQHSSLVVTFSFFFSLPRCSPPLRFFLFASHTSWALAPGCRSPDVTPTQGCSLPLQLQLHAATFHLCVPHSCALSAAFLYRQQVNLHYTRRFAPQEYICMLYLFAMHH